MTFDQIIGVTGLAVAVVSTVLAYIFYRKTIRSKVLAIGVTGPMPLLFTFEPIDLTYRGRQVQALSRSIVLLWNRGTAPIEASDFISPIRVAVGPSLLNFDLLDKDAASQVTFNSEESTIEITLLRPGEAVAFTAEMSSDDQRPSLTVAMKSADMATFMRIPPGLLLGAVLLLVPLVYLLGLVGLLIYGASFHSPQRPEELPSAMQWAAILGIGAILGAIFIGLIKGALWLYSFLAARFYSPVVLKFSERSGRAWADRGELKKLRTSVLARQKK